MKIDNSTYKAIKKDKKRKNRKPSRFEMSELGSYGRIKKKRNIKLFMVLFLLALIVADVIFSIVVFHTRKTWFIIIACVMSIPFARNIIDFFMCLRCKPLDKETYNAVNEISNETGRKIIYDLPVTDEDGLVFVPAACVYNNNIIAFTPDEKDAKKREKIKKYVGMVNDSGENQCRIVVTDNINTFKKEISRIKDAEGASDKADEQLMDKFYAIGF